MTPSWQALMQSPESMQVEAQRRESAGPSPVCRMSITPAMTGTAGAVIPAGALTGHASTHLPQRVQAEFISSTRSSRLASRKLVIAAPEAAGAVYDQTYGTHSAARSCHRDGKVRRHREACGSIAGRDGGCGVSACAALVYPSAQRRCRLRRPKTAQAMQEMPQPGHDATTNNRPPTGRPLFGRSA